MCNILSVASVCAILTIFSVLAGPTQISVAEKTFRNDVNYPSVQVTLLSIEERLRNLENSLSVQCEIAINGKIDYYGHKIDNIERDLSRFQVYMRMELDKISENISSKNFKDDITKDRTIRKIDTIYERINHRLGNIEEQIDITNIKSQNAREMIMTKLEKMEESLNIRDADMEAELADAVAAIDDLKTSCTNMEENILNVTKETTKIFFKSNEKSIKKIHGQTINFLENSNKSLSQDLANVQQTVNLLLNQTYNNSNSAKRAKEDLNENLNEYANKITDMYVDLWKKTDTLESSLQNIAKVANITRSEQQNGLRALMVQVGRKSSKQAIQSDSLIDNQIAQLSQRIDSNFENVMLAQNLFLESCHRVQMDESQLESQIGMVLDKLIDIFENKTSVGPKDIEQLEHLIRTHDSNIRRSIYHITNNLLSLMQKTRDGNDEIVDYVNNQRLQLDSFYTMLADIVNSHHNSEETLQGLQQQLTDGHHQMHTTLSQINSTNNFITKILNASHSSNSSTNTKLQHTLEFIKNIYHILTSIEMKINKSYLDYFFNKYNIDVIAHRFGKKLNDYIQSTEGTNNTNRNNNTNIEDKQEIPKLLLEIFGENPNPGGSVDPYDDFPYRIESNLSKSFNASGHEIENIVLLCEDENKSTGCGKINITQYITVNQNETKNNTNILTKDCLPNYIDLIDVRSNSAITPNPNCTLRNNTVDAIPTNNLENSTNECLPNYINMIDVRSNDGTSSSNCTNITVNLTSDDSTNFRNYSNVNTELYEIDVRYQKPDETLINQNKSVNINNTKTSHHFPKNDSEEIDGKKQELLDTTSTELDYTTEKPGTTTTVITTTPDILSTLDLKVTGENQILEKTEETTETLMTKNWTEEQVTVKGAEDTTDTSTIKLSMIGQTLASDGEESVTDENYPLNSLEEDSNEINNEFEYTNHEYH